MLISSTIAVGHSFIPRVIHSILCILNGRRSVQTGRVLISAKNECFAQGSAYNPGTNDNDVSLFTGRELFS